MQLYDKCHKGLKREKKTSKNHNVGEFANNPRKDAYPKGLMGLVYGIFDGMDNFVVLVSA